MRKQTKTLAVLSAAALFAAAAPIMTNMGTYRVLAAQSGWTEEDGRLYYYDEDGYKETNTWKKRNGDWFYLDEEGEIATNQRVDDYFVNDEGTWQRTNGFRLKMRSAMTARILRTAAPGSILARTARL